MNGEVQSLQGYNTATVVLGQASRFHEVLGRLGAHYGWLHNTHVLPPVPAESVTDEQPNQDKRCHLSDKLPLS
jgi:hypothetical protein